MRATVVPNRNAIMLAIAWGVAVSEQADVVAVTVGYHNIADTFWVETQLLRQLCDAVRLLQDAELDLLADLGSYVSLVGGGVPVLGANLPREQMREAMADASLDQLLPGPARKAQEQAIRQGHCGLLPEPQIRPMTRVQIARDKAMAETIAAASAPGKTVVLLAGAGHVEPGVGVPLHLPEADGGLSIDSEPGPAPAPSADEPDEDEQNRERPVDVFHAQERGHKFARGKREMRAADRARITATE